MTRLWPNSWFLISCKINVWTISLCSFFFSYRTNHDLTLWCEMNMVLYIWFFLSLKKKLYEFIDNDDDWRNNNNCVLCTYVCMCIRLQRFFSSSLMSYLMYFHIWFGSDIRSSSWLFYTKFWKKFQIFIVLSLEFFILLFFTREYFFSTELCGESQSDIIANEINLWCTIHILHIKKFGYCNPN